MGRHQQHGSARRAHVSLGAATLAGLVCSATYALAAPAPAPVAVAVPAPATTVATPAVATTATSSLAKATARSAAARATTTCDLSGPPVFGDPAHPNRITNRDCGYRDGQGRQHSRDPWIDGQLRDAR